MWHIKQAVKLKLSLRVMRLELVSKDRALGEPYGMHSEPYKSIDD